MFFISRTIKRARAAINQLLPRLSVGASPLITPAKLLEPPDCDVHGNGSTGSVKTISVAKMRGRLLPLTEHAAASVQRVGFRVVEERAHACGCVNARDHRKVAHVNE